MSKGENNFFSIIQKTQLLQKSNLICYFRNIENQLLRCETHRECLVKL